MLCPHCGYKTSERNPSGYCDHIYYPLNCDQCKYDAQEQRMREALYRMKIALLEAFYIPQIADFLLKIANKLKGKKHE